MPILIQSGLSLQLQRGITYEGYHQYRMRRRGHVPGRDRFRRGELREPAARRNAPHHHRDRRQGTCQQPGFRQCARTYRHRSGRKQQDFRQARRGLPPAPPHGGRPEHLHRRYGRRHRDRRGGFRRGDLHARTVVRIRLDHLAGAGGRQCGRQERRECGRVQEYGRNLG